MVVYGNQENEFFPIGQQFAPSKPKFPMKIMFERMTFHNGTNPWLGNVILDELFGKRWDAIPFFAGQNLSALNEVFKNKQGVLSDKGPERLFPFLMAEKHGALI